MVDARCDMINNTSDVVDVTCHAIGLQVMQLM
jgi:hypothetical protein